MLFVCTANVCRSRCAELALNECLARLGNTSPVNVTSAGTNADGDEAICREVAATMRITSDRSRSHRLTARDLERAGLVLAMERTHRAACARLLPSCRPRLFTLRQAADLATVVAQDLALHGIPEGAPPMPTGSQERLRWFVAELDAARGALAGQPEGSEDIVDRHGPDPHEATIDDVRDAVERLGQAMSACLNF